MATIYCLPGNLKSAWGINTGVVSNPATPFGGLKQSGLGREGGRVRIEEFLEYKYTAIPVATPKS